MVFVDTSALLAVLDADDSFHDQAKRVWEKLLLSESALITTNYILVESSAVIQNRLGMQAVRTFNDDIVPMMHVEWISEGAHKAALAAFIMAAKRKLSLVDCVSFEVMRDKGIFEAFAFDKHFKDQGFTCLSFKR